MRRWYPIAVIVAAGSFAFWAHGRLPDRLPVHWGLHGEVNGWGSKISVTLGMPLLCAAFWALLNGVRRTDPRRDNYEKFSSSFDLIVAASVTLIAAMEFVTIGAALGWRIPVERVAPACIGLFLIAIGNVFPRLRSNWFIGIRTPWALSDDRVWERTQRVAGYGLVLAGVLLVLSAAVPSVFDARIGIVATVAAATIAVIYSAVVALNSDS